MKIRIIILLLILILAQLCLGFSFIHIWGKITGKYRVDTIELPGPETHNGWKWLSFPALDNVLNDADIAENILADILDPNILDKVEAQDYTIDYNIGTQTWNNSSEQFLRTEGFKFHMNDDFTFEVPGFKEQDNTSIVLAGNNDENWVGYWLEETQLVSDAFSDYWSGSNIHFIQHQNWTAFYLGRWRIELYSGRLPTLSYGDMVVVKCNTTINNFQWESGITVDKTVFAKPEYFTYEEQSDYTPLYIELDSSNMPQEIGAFVNGECIGATVVEDTLTQINAYTTSVPPGDIELELYYDNRSENKIISSYNCVTSTNPGLVMKQLTTKDKDDAWFINLREGSDIIPEIIEFSASNYPNPFNPTTTISYSLPLEGRVSLNIYNVKGQLVRQLIDGSQSEGYYEVVWNGKDNNKKNVSSGIYFYKLSTKDETIMKKMLMLK
ncbi:MAG: T9SS type A sorting domain-containing protein [Candidatus Tenebribacter mawsonii]|nr:T9SS type A sorting domain-containing protein [Candidatus Tenebribacter mawsonii]